MDVESQKNILNSKGQALFEFVMIIPFVLVLIGTMVAIVGSINGAINQVKATRNYFYMTINNSSMTPRPPSLSKLKTEGIETVGIDFLGWREMRDGEKSFAPCFKITTFLGEEPKNEDCNNKFEDKYSTFIKVKTFYGLCSATYEIGGTVPGINLADHSCRLK
jgi:hypothetical protein